MMTENHDETLALARELVKNLRDLREAVTRDKNKRAMTDIRETMDRIQKLLTDRIYIKKS